MHRAKHKEKMALFSGKRIAAFVLAFLLCVGTLPLNSFAVEGEDMSQDTPAATEYVVDADVSDPTSDKSFIEDEAPAEDADAPVSEATDAADAQDNVDGEQNEPAVQAGSTVDALTLSAPQLVADSNDQTVPASSTVGYKASFHISSTDPDGVNGVWIGYRFTLPMPASVTGIRQQMKFDGYGWLMDLKDGTKAASPVYDSSTKTWVLEGKYFYDQADNPLGSSGAQHLTRGISVSLGYSCADDTLTPTMEAWLVDKADSSTGSVNGTTLTVTTTPGITASGTTSSAASGYYSASKQAFYATKAQAEAAGAGDAVWGRVYQTTTVIRQSDDSNTLLPPDTDIPVHVSTAVSLNGVEVTDATQQPILLGVHYRTNHDAADSGMYTTLANGDLSLGGLVNLRGIAKGGSQGVLWDVPDITRVSVSDVTSADGTFGCNVQYTPNANYGGVYGTFGPSFLTFVPVPESDSAQDKRVLSVGPVTAGPVAMRGNSTPVIGSDGGVSTIKVEKHKAFNGAIQPDLAFYHYVNGKQWIQGMGDTLYVTAGLESAQTDTAYSISAYDDLIKVDTRAFEIDTTVSTVSERRNGSAYTGEYILQYGVLKNGADNWDSEDAMKTGGKDDLVFYDAGKVPSGSTAVAILIKARNGNMLSGYDRPGLYSSLKVKSADELAGNIYSIVHNVDIWFYGSDPDTVKPDIQYNSRNFTASSVDDDGNEVAGQKHQILGDSLFIAGFNISRVRIEKLNGVSKSFTWGPPAVARSTYDVSLDQRVSDFRYVFGISSGSGNESPDQEFELLVTLTTGADSLENSKFTELIEDSFRMDAVYTPAAKEGDPGYFSGGIAPTSVTKKDDGKYEVVFTVKGTGTHSFSASAKLGDALNADKEVGIGLTTVYTRINASTQSKKLLAGSHEGHAYALITKSAVAGFRKMAEQTVIEQNADVHYRLAMSAQNNDLTGALLLDVLPFNNDGRGTKLSDGASISVSQTKPVTLSLTTDKTTVGTDIEFYYTTDAAIQTNPVKSVGDLAGTTVTGDSCKVFGVTWLKAARTVGADGKSFTYAVPANALAIMGVGTVGANETPTTDIYLDTNGMKGDDALINSAGLSANEFGKAMEAQSADVHRAERKITGKAWIDVNNNGQQDADEKSLAGLTVKLYQGDTEITTDEYGNAYNVTTAADGTYMFDDVPSSVNSYHVEFSGGTIGQYAVSPKAATGVADDKNSDVTGDPADGTLNKAVSDDVTLLTLAQQQATGKHSDVQQLDAGFAPKYTVSFDTNGGTPNIDDQTVVAHDKVAKPADPAKVDQVFAGWYYTDADGNEKQWSFDDPVTADLVLKAKWVDATAATLEVKGTKTLTGGGKTNTDIAADQFKFTVTRTDNGTASAVSGLPTTTIGTKAGAANGAEIDFGTWSFTKSGTYTFTVSEETPAAGYTKAGDVTISVVVTQNGDKLVATMTPADITFANTYTYPDDIKDTVSGSVKLADKDGNDKAFNDGDFSVKIAENATNDTTGYTGFTAGDKDVSADGSFSLDEISFSKAGTYKFTVTQNDKGEAGYTYDDASYEVTVTVELDEATNTLKKTVSYTKNGADVTEIIFNNVYTEYSVSFDTDGGTPNIDDQAIPSGEKATKPTDPTKADSVFAGWYYTDADGNEKQWSFDDPVTADLALKAKWVDATAATLDVEGVKLLIADKHGNHDIEADQFKFTVKQTSGNAAAVSGLPTAAVGTKAGTATGAEINFGTWVFTKAGTYTFVISEEEPGAGYTKAEDVTVTVTVRQNGDELVATMTTPDSIRFINYYEEAELITNTIPVSVTLKDENGNDMPFAEGDFTANVEVDRLNIGTKHDSKTGDFSADGTLNINTAYLAPDVYVYTITQQDKGAAGYTYDDSIFVATVTVTLDKATNTLQKTVTYTKNGQPVDKLEFNNTYTSPDAITDTTIGSVTLKDEDGNDKTFNDGDFSVKIVANDANDTTGYTGFVAGDKDVVADGSFSFDEISFSKAGTYKFTVTQNDKGAAGYTYDDASYEVTVTVELDKATNTLKKTITYTKDGVEVTEVVFNNTYATPAPSDITFSGNKTLKENGVDKAMEEGQFSFTIEADASNDATGYTGFTAGSQDVAANGNFSFGTVSFTKVGVYKFTISEVDKGAAGYHYDANAVTVTVTVELDTATNTLVATATYEKAGEAADGIAFANTYDTPDAVDQALTGNVSLDGDRKTSDIKAGDFTFKVTPDAGNDESGYTLPTTAAASKDGGDIDFSKITFTKEGTYKFTVSQDNLGKEGYTYDDSTYVVTVTVTLDKATNKLVPVIKLEKVKDGVTTAVDAISFANSYKKPTPANPSVEPSKPSDRPQTGDTTNVAVWGGLFLLSAALLVVCFIAGWKRRKTSNTK